MPALGEAIGGILDSYADVIEGGSSYAGGTIYKGIPGNYSNDPGWRSNTDKTFTTVAAGDSTSVMVATTYSYDNNRWAKDESPPWFLYCSVYGGSATPTPLYAARKISSWDQSNTRFLTASWPSAVGNNSTVIAKEGFKRLPNHIDIEDEGPAIENGYDRFFQLTALPGERAEFFGNGYHTYRTTLELRLRILKYARARDAIASALENLMIIRTILTRGYDPNHRPNYVRALLADKGSPSIEKQDLKKVVAVDKFELIYSVSADFT